jgi:cation:H+ antiporter
MSSLTIVLFVLGFVLLIGGAELLVRGASRLALTLGIPPLLVGLTVVAVGTSSPELAVGVQSALTDNADVALGNVIGSNIANILLILGLSAVITPLAVARQLIRLDVPIMILVAMALLLAGLDGQVGRMEGLLLTVGYAGYTIFSIMQSRKRRLEEAVVDAQVEAIAPPPTRRRAEVLLNIVLLVGGLALLIVGSDWLVDGAVALAQRIGIDELIIGLTVVAVGTSLPEIAASIVASLRGQRDIVVGNIVGSNIANILLVLGLTALISPIGIAVPREVLAFDIPFMIACSLACLPIFFHGMAISRAEGAFFLAYYVAYTLYLILNATQHTALPFWSAAMLWFVVPLTVVTLVIIGLRALRDHRRAI